MAKVSQPIIGVAISSPEHGGWFNDLQDNPIKYLALCAGAGIGTLGWDCLGWECAGAIEKLSVRREVLAHHHPRAKILDDVFAVQGEEIPAADVWIITAPCQELSAANPDGEGLTGDHPWFGCVRLLRECRLLGTAPSLVLLEQVPPLVRYRKRAGDWEMVKTTVGESGYRLLDHEVIDALPIYGRQSRKRLFAVWAAPWIVDTEGTTSGFLGRICLGRKPDGRTRQ